VTLTSPAYRASHASKKAFILSICSCVYWS